MEIPGQISAEINTGWVVGEQWLCDPRNRLTVVASIRDFDFDDRPWWSDLWSPTIQGWGELQSWRGNEIQISETNEAVELGMQQYSKETKVLASFRLEKTTFEFLRLKLGEYTPTTVGADRILLGCGFVSPEGKIPRSRPVTWPEKIYDPVSLTAEPRRMAFEIVGVFDAKEDWKRRRLEPLSQWMAVID